MASKDNQINSSKYKMDHEKRGIALIVNINKYDPNPFKLEGRERSIKDVENLKKTLEYLEFDLDLVENSTKSEIEEHLQQIASIDHRDSDCFLCIIISHRNEEKIVTSDSELISLEEIMAPIKSCPTLRNKPKIFFVQACRGETIMESRYHGVSYSQSNKNIAYNNENESDLFIYDSTLPNLDDGSIFIKSFCDVFNDAYKNLPDNMSLAQMISKLNYEVSKTVQQITHLIFRMSKEIYFLPKNVNQNF